MFPPEDICSLSAQKKKSEKSVEIHGETVWSRTSLFLSVPLAVAKATAPLSSRCAPTAANGHRYIQHTVAELQLQLNIWPICEAGRA